MKELVFPHLHKPIEKINELLTKINKHPILQKGIFSAIIGTIGLGLVLTTLGTATMLVGKLVKGYGLYKTSSSAYLDTLQTLSFWGFTEALLQRYD